MPAASTLIPTLWDIASPSALSADPLETLRYRSNLLGADLRITNFGGGNTSSKYDLIDPMTGRATRVMAVKGSGGDLGSIKNQGFAILYMDRLDALKGVYRGEEFEDDMVELYPSCAFAGNKVPASIDTPLHAFIPYPHVDHLHPDWAIALAASANAATKLAEFNKRYRHNLTWLPWQRPGFELALMLEKTVADPTCDGILLGSHGLFTWGNTQQSCYENSLAMTNDLGDFVLEHQAGVGDQLFGGQCHAARPDAAEIANAIFPFLRGALATTRRSIGHFTDSPEAARFANSHWAPDLALLGTSCPDHFIRTRIAPLLVDWNPAAGSIKAQRAPSAPPNEPETRGLALRTATPFCACSSEAQRAPSAPPNGPETRGLALRTAAPFCACYSEDLEQAILDGLAHYRERYTAYYTAHAEPGSPALRDPNPSVVLIPGIGMFSFGRNKKEARITSEFYSNAIRVMAGATAMDDDSIAEPLPGFSQFHNYVALPPREAFRIEYWALEEAKIQRMPPEKRFARRIFLVIGGGSGIGRAVCRQLAASEAHIMIADRNQPAADAVRESCTALAGQESVDSCFADLTSRDSLQSAIAAAVHRFGGIDAVVNTAAMAPSSLSDGELPEEHWGLMLEVNVTGNYVLADAVHPILVKQNLPASIVFTSSANAVVAKKGSESYDVSKAAMNHLIRELAISLRPLVRVNGVAPATVVSGSDMFPRDRVIFSLKKYGFEVNEDESVDTLRDRLAAFYAGRNLLNLAIRPEDCAEAILWLAGDSGSRTTGHVIPVDGGLTEAFLR